MARASAGASRRARDARRAAAAHPAVAATALGPADAPAARLLVVPSPRLGGVVRECVAGACPTPDAGERGIEANLVLAAGSTVLIDPIGTVLPAPEGGNDDAPVDVEAAAGRAEGSGLDDPDPGNDTASDSVQVVPAWIFDDGF